MEAIILKLMANSNWSDNKIKEVIVEWNTVRKREVRKIRTIKKSRKSQEELASKKADKPL